MTVEIRVLKKPELRDPHMICGLPGSGYVGKIAVDHLIKELKAELFAEIYADSFPPQVLIRQDSSIDPVRNELYYWKNPMSPDLIIYTGDAQPVSPEGDYEVANKVLDLVQGFNIKLLYTFGAYITGAFTRTPRVFTSATEGELARRMREFKVVVTNQGTITGMNGLILGLAKIRGIKGISLLGETSGYIVDAKAAQMVLEVFTRTINLNINMTTLEERAREVESIIHALGATQRPPEKPPRDRDRLGYIS